MKCAFLGAKIVRAIQTAKRRMLKVVKVFEKAVLSLCEAPGGRSPVSRTRRKSSYLGLFKVCFCDGSFPFRGDTFDWIFLSMAPLSLEMLSPRVKYSFIIADTCSGLP